MKKASCEYFVTDSNRVPVREFIDSLDPKTQRKFFFVVKLLEEFGRKLPQPHAKYIGDEINEKEISIQRRKLFLERAAK